ncbi:MAG: methyl-accepting chemotaxis protein [Chloroflexi bacterium]|nr:methyl-accepting chemotaxis protein [Chloroflexota bacterium]
MQLGIRGKLYAGFGTVLVLLGLVAFVGYRNTTRFASDFSSLYDDRLVPVLQLSDVQMALYELRLGALGYDLADAAGRQKIRADDAKWIRTIEDRMREYAATELVTAEVEDLAAWQRSFPAYVQTRGRVLDLSDQGKRDEANALRVGEAGRLFTESLNSLTDLTRVQQHVGAAMNADTRATASTSIWLLLGISTLAVALGAGMAAIVSRGIVRGVRDVQTTLTSLTERCASELSRALEALAHNDLTVKVVPLTPAIVRYGSDEIGETARITNLMRDKVIATVDSYEQARVGLQHLLRQVQEASDTVAATSGQLGQAAAQTTGAVQQVTQAIQQVAAGSGEASQSAQASAEAVTQLGQAIDGIARGAGEQAQQVQAVSTTTMQMAAGVEQVAERARDVAEASAEMKDVAEHGARAVRQTVDGMSEIRTVVAAAAARVGDLGRLGEKIGAVVETIDDIAEQTNLLALNAAIEAARAGEHGKGFAVVADEVRKLAERSQRETRAISELIREVQARTREAVDAMEQGSVRVEQGSARADEAGSSLAEILRAVDTTVSQVTQIASAAQEMAGGARGVVDSMGSISAVVEENSAATEQMAAQAGQVNAAIDAIASVSESNSAATEEVSASAEQMSAQVEEMNAQAEELASTAEGLRDLVAQFQLDQSAEPRQVGGQGERQSGQRERQTGQQRAAGRRRAA